MWHISRLFSDMCLFFPFRQRMWLYFFIEWFLLGYAYMFIRKSCTDHGFYFVYNILTNQKNPTCAVFYIRHPFHIFEFLLWISFNPPTPVRVNKCKRRNTANPLICTGYFKILIVPKSTLLIMFSVIHTYIYLHVKR